MTYNLIVKFPKLVKKFYAAARVVNIVHSAGIGGKEHSFRVGFIFVNMSAEQREILKEQIEHLSLEQNQEES